MGTAVSKLQCCEGKRLQIYHSEDIAATSKGWLLFITFWHVCQDPGSAWKPNEGIVFVL